MEIKDLVVNHLDECARCGQTVDIHNDRCPNCGEKL